jgi:glutamine synthetase
MPPGMGGMPPGMGGMPSFIIVEYIWLGGKKELRSKTRILDINISEFKGLEDIPEWNYDGSSAGQATGFDSDVIIKPRALFKDPSNMSFIVMCDTWTPDDKPLETNRRHWAEEIFNKKKDEEPWFGIEQEYFLMDKKTGRPLGWVEDNMPPQGQYYCSNGTGNAIGRHIVEEHMHICLSAGIKLSGTNAEVAPGQWEYQVGPCTGIDAGDQLWISRFLLIRVAEKHDVVVNFDPKPLSEGNWNGSGCHTNYSTKNMREGVAGKTGSGKTGSGKTGSGKTGSGKTGSGKTGSGKTGLDFINDALEKLEKNHMKHMAVYGEGNEERMTGKYETARYDTFTKGIANRGASIRIGNKTFKDKKGYFEDRRPSSNMDPYDVIGIMFETTVLI